MHTPAARSILLLLSSVHAVLATEQSLTNSVSSSSGALGGSLKLSRAVSDSSRLSKRQSLPPANYDIDYCRFFDFSSTVAGTKIWLEGGAFTDHQNNIYSNPGYLSIDFSKKFTLPIKSSSSNVDTSNIYPKNYPLTWLGGLYSSTDGKKLFKYGGFFQDNYSYPLDLVKVQPNSLFEFDTDSGAFTKHDTPNTVSRAANGGYVNVPEIGSGFWMGGFISNNTDTSFQTWKWPTEFMVLDSVLTIDTGSGTVTNTSRTDPAFPPTSAGELVHIPAKSGSGFLVSIGGFLGPTGLLSTSATNSDYKLAPLDKINVYDIDNKVWYTQSTSGNTPPQRQLGCAVVARAQDGSSFSIILHAGANWGNTQGYGDIWVLSLPSFQWVKISDDASNTIRMTHHCHIMSDNQMVVVGGRGIDQYTYILQGVKWKDNKMGKCDPRGFVNILDLNTFQWVTEFDPDYKGYIVHDKILALIGGSGTGGATQLTPKNGWDSAGLGAVFASVMKSDSKKPSPSIQTSKKGGGAGIGAIVGGVVGGVIVLAAIAGLAFYCYRRSHSSPPPPPPQPPMANQTQPVPYLAPPPADAHPQGGYYQPVYPQSPIHSPQLGAVGQTLDEKNQYSPYQQPVPGYTPGYPYPQPYGQPAHQPPPTVYEVPGSTEYQTQQPSSPAHQSPHFTPVGQPVVYNELPTNGPTNR